MTEHNVELLHGRETHSERPILLGLACLFTLALFIMLIVGGSFSKIISEGEISGLTLQAAGLEIEAEAEWYDDDDLSGRSASDIHTGTEPYIICSFTVRNDSAMNVLLDVVIATEYDSHDSDPLADVDFFLYINNGDEWKGYTLDEQNTLEDEGIYYDGNTITVTVKDYPLNIEEEIEFMFVVDAIKKGEENGPNYPNGFQLSNPSNAVTITAKQAIKGE